MGDWIGLSLWVCEIVSSLREAFPNADLMVAPLFELQMSFISQSFTGFGQLRNLGCH